MQRCVSLFLAFVFVNVLVRIIPFPRLYLFVYSESAVVVRENKIRKQLRCGFVVFPRTWKSWELHRLPQQYPIASLPSSVFAPLCRPILNSSHFRFTFLTFIALFVFYLIVLLLKSVRLWCSFTRSSLCFPEVMFTGLRMLSKKDQAHKRWMHLQYAYLLSKQALR